LKAKILDFAFVADFLLSTNFGFAGCEAASAFERSEGKRSFGGFICRVGSVCAFSSQVFDFIINVVSGWHCDQCLIFLHLWCGDGFCRWIKNLYM
jgi:hypothetical protein